MDILEHERGKIFKLPLPAGRALPKRLSAAVAGAVENVLSLGRLDSVYRDIGAKDETMGFIDESLQKLKIRYDVSGDDLAAVPATGPLVVVANHPFGGIEGLMLGALLLRVRPDVKIMANYLLGRIPELRDLLLCVDPFGTRAATMRNARSLKEALRWLQGGHALAVFPAGSVSHLHVRERKVIDPEWNATIARLVHKARAHVVPVFFDGANSLFFQLAGMVHPKLRTVLLPHELLNKADKTIKIRIGSAVPFRKMETLDDKKLMGYLRMRTYALKHRCLEAAGGTAMNADRLSVVRRAVSGAADPGMIRREVDSLPSRQLLLESDGFAVFYAKAHQIPNLLFEIGRLREVTFRKVGEGTGRPVDLARFDLYYTHLFVWSTRTLEVVGAYRFRAGRSDPRAVRQKGPLHEYPVRFQPGLPAARLPGHRTRKVVRPGGVPAVILPAAPSLEGHRPLRRPQPRIHDLIRPGYHQRRLFRPVQAVDRLLYDRQPLRAGPCPAHKPEKTAEEPVAQAARS